MPGEISAGDLFPVPLVVEDQDPAKAAKRHRNLIAQALNEVAAAAFSAQVLIDTSDVTQATTTSSVAYSGLSLTVISPVPANIFVAVSLPIVATTWTAGQGQFDARLLRDTTLRRISRWYPSAQGARDSVVLLDVQTDLEPRTAYTYTATIRNTAGTNVYTVNPDASDSFIIMAAIVLPRIL